MRTKTPIFLWLVFLFGTTILSGQGIPATMPLTSFVNQSQPAATASAVQSISPSAMLDPKTVDMSTDWDVNLMYLGKPHGNEIPADVMELEKLQKTSGKLTDQTDKTTTELHAKTFVETPVVATEFKGNTYNGWTPPDNSIAISDAGEIVSATNSSLLFAEENGAITFQSSLSGFFSVLNLSGGYFDPKVVYDPSEDKFVLIVLNGNTPSTSKVVMAFSSTNDPNDAWWFYTFDGDPQSGNNWFDFPSIGVSETELYVSGNLFDSDDDFTNVLIYQVEKANGFSGGNIDWLYWYNVSDANGSLDFTVVPISYGFDGWLTPGIFFISSDASGGSSVMVYFTTGTINDAPSLEVSSVSVGSYSVSGDGLQLGSNDFMSTNDCRILSGFYANGIIHFVMNSAVFSNYTGIYYGRINVNNATATNSTFGLSGYEYCFPSIAPFTTSATDQDVVIGFLRTGSDIYPEFRVVSADDDFNWSSSVNVRSGDSFVDFNSESTERWGDYSGISRRHLTGAVEVWISGCYGENSDGGGSNILSSWIAEISNSVATQPPVANFTANQTTINAGQTINYSDLSTNNPNSWSWSFQGGSPGSSSSQNPTVTYNTAGVYNVSLNAGNAAGSDVELKTAYITVLPNILPPVTNFTANQTTITAGQSVNFTDLSTNSPTAWNWNFQSGSPGSSSSQNPSITYNNPGTYNVSLTTSNSAGSDTETKTQYITVNPSVIAPIADFTADETNIPVAGIVSFEDLSQNNPDNWTWSFQGGTPNVSNLQDPIIVYSSAGVYDVSLVVSNAAGNNSETKAGYIIVGATSVETANSLDGFKIFPNPSNGSEVSIEFDLPEAKELEVFVVDVSGKVVKLLLERRFKAGQNRINFNSYALAAGTYFVLVQQADKTIIQHEKMVIIH
ncbi:MAG: PKD domain-containing protein [Saprospiraceae bacterium]|nr:PKD domain-containing protein [Saprospiraceae bacterium]